MLGFVYTVLIYAVIFLLTFLVKYFIKKLFANKKRDSDTLLSPKIYYVTSSSVKRKKPRKTLNIPISKSKVEVSKDTEN